MLGSWTSWGETDMTPGVIIVLALAGAAALTACVFAVARHLRKRRALAAVRVAAEAAREVEDANHQVNVDGVHAADGADGDTIAAWMRRKLGGK